MTPRQRYALHVATREWLANDCGREYHGGDCGTNIEMYVEECLEVYDQQIASAGASAR